MSREYRESIRLVTGVLEVELVELRDWTCCGATAAHSLDERMSVVLPARNLAEAGALSLELAAACPQCYNRLAYSKEMIRRKRVDDPWSIDPEIELHDLARLLASGTALERIRDAVRAPLKGLPVVCYYGCQVVRPPKIVGLPDYENPMHLDRLVEALGASALDWSYKATCCGAGIGVPRPEIGLALVGNLLEAARASGARAIVVCCPLCHGNLDILQPEINGQRGWGGTLPIFYYTELLGVAFGVGAVRRGLGSHFVDPRPLLAELAGDWGGKR
jgi:heterodisulfide reductase subunit B